MLSTLASQKPSMWMPPQSSSFAEGVDALFYYILIVSVVMTVVIVALMALFAFKYRQKDRDFVPHGPTHNTALELGWSSFPAIFLASFFVFGFHGYNNMADLPEKGEDTFVVRVTGQKWFWSFVISQK